MVGERKQWFWALVIVAATVFAASAHGAATPLSPAPGAVVTTSHPVFSWSVPTAEESDGIYIALSPQITPEGRFYDENIVDSDIFFGNETRWSPTSPLPAGGYWWLIWSHDRDTFDDFYSTPSSFSIPASLRIVSVRVKRYTGLRMLDVFVTWTSNTEQATVAARLLQGTRRVWSKTELEQYYTIGASVETNVYWFARKRIRPGTGLRLEISVSAQGETARFSRRVRAP